MIAAVSYKDNQISVGHTVHTHHTDRHDRHTDQTDPHEFSQYLATPLPGAQVIITYEHNFTSNIFTFQLHFYPSPMAEMFLKRSRVHSLRIAFSINLEVAWRLHWDQKELSQGSKATNLSGTGMVSICPFIPMIKRRWKIQYLYFNIKTMHISTNKVIKSTVWKLQKDK